MYDCRFLGGCLDPRTHCYTLEVSFFSYTTADSLTQAPYTEEACIPPYHPSIGVVSLESAMVVCILLDSRADLQLGKNVAKTFLTYYNLSHLLVAGTSCTRKTTTNSTSTSPHHHQ